ncbi:MAG: hypothetical protein D6770_05950 [Anaerolineae bacterium]|nr:MAG: hypothetical protein D6770_05950 [Anaerolineae bacterium]
MKNKHHIIRALGLILLSLGALFGTLYAGAAIWGNWEAFQFDIPAAFRSDKTLPTLRCPTLITTGENGTVSVEIKNPTNDSLRRTVRIHISEGDILAMREFTEQVSLGPGESRRLAWEVFPQDRVFDLFILVRVYLPAKYPLPSEDATCGIMVLDLPSLRGRDITAFLIIASLAGMALGVVLSGRWLREAAPKLREAVSSARGVVVFVLIAMLAAAFRWLWLGTIALVLVILLTVITVLRYTQSSTG